MLKKIITTLRQSNTYRIGLLQARAYRILKQETSTILQPLGISTVEWAFLGLLYDKKVLRMKDAAQELGVEAPFITATFAQLHVKKLVQESRSEVDVRVKLLSLTDLGRSFVEETEEHVRKSMRYLMAGANPRDLIGYVSILELIIKNEK